eukprot:1883489-Amphidinium_carterae.1
MNRCVFQGFPLPGHASGQEAPLPIQHEPKGQTKMTNCSVSAQQPAIPFGALFGQRKKKRQPIHYRRKETQKVSRASRAAAVAILEQLQCRINFLGWKSS